MASQRELLAKAKVTVFESQMNIPWLAVSTC